MFKRSQVNQLFPVLVWEQELADEVAAPLNAHLREQAVRLKPAGAGDAPNAGWQSRNDLQTLPEFAQMTDIINAAAQKVLGFLRVVETPFEITGCWLNVNPPGTGHPLHSHPNNYLSGVYYVATPKQSDHILFHDFRMERQVVLPRFTERVPQNMASARVATSEGLLVMFPSWLPHSVEPNESDAERISLAFNLMFSDFTVTQARPIWSGDSTDA